VEVLEDKLEPLEGVGVADVRIVLVVPSGAAYETPPGVIIPVACDPAELAAGAPVVSEAGAEEVETAVDDAEDEELLWLDEAEDAAEEPDELADVLLAADDEVAAEEEAELALAEDVEDAELEDEVLVDEDVAALLAAVDAVLAAVVSWVVLLLSGGSSPTPTRPPRRPAWGARFLIMRPTSEWSRRWRVKSLASETEAMAKTMAMQRSVRVTFLGFETNMLFRFLAE